MPDLDRQTTTHHRNRSTSRTKPRKLSTQKMKKVLTLTTQRVPREATHWSGSDQSRIRCLQIRLAVSSPA
ncbi:hypothetical protein DOZ80_20810 [Pseudomonas fluorescens]|uniref:Uncharacterized protein n=1 Tax=Pseudomonas fluorescens TaxID=294 RepID=A0A327MXM6_PSEFL|nr:hypothetical protein DOZ80_20810 [Pseudomonas fluorescens]